MKFAVLCPNEFREYYYNTYVDLFEKCFPEIHVEYMFYEHFEDSLQLLKDKQSKYDAILFGGKGCYNYLRRVLRQETVWVYMERNQCDIYRAIMDVKSRGYDPLRLTFDCFTSDDLVDVYLEMGYSPDSLQLLPFEEEERHGEEGYDEKVFQFHKKNYLEGNCAACCTRTSTVAKMLKEAKIPFVYAYPIRSTIRDQIRYSRRLVASRSYLKESEQMVAIIKLIDFSEYMSPENLYEESQIQTSITLEVNDYARSIHSLMVAQDRNTFILFANKEEFLLQTNELKDFCRIKRIMSVSKSIVHIGIGFAKSSLDAYRLARQGVWLQNHSQCNGMIIYYDSQRFIRIDSAGVIQGQEQFNNAQLLQRAADDTSLSVETIMKLYFAIKKQGKIEYTVEQIAEMMGISRRSASRIITKLEASHYAVLSSKCMIKDKGRPACCYRILLDGM